MIHIRTDSKVGALVIIKTMTAETAASRNGLWIGLSMKIGSIQRERSERFAQGEAPYMVPSSTISKMARLSTYHAGDRWKEFEFDLSHQRMDLEDVLSLQIEYEIRVHGATRTGKEREG